MSHETGHAGDGYTASGSSPPARECTSCEQIKPLEEYRNRRQCRACEAVARGRRRKPGEVEAYNDSVAGIARNLVYDHGYSRHDAVILATRLRDPFETCAICGLLNHYIADGRPCFGWSRRERLTIDHIVAGGPSTLANTRLLDHGCNSYRGAGHYTDVEVLRAARWFYLELLPPRRLWWLHSTPGVGGRRFRNAIMQRKYERLTGRSLPMTGPLSDATTPQPLEEGSA
jgi:hypothetical protein